MDARRHRWLLAWGCWLLAAGVPAFAARPAVEFQGWAEGFAEDWVRLNPLMATVAQYFDGPEQDALDRRLALANPYNSPVGRTMTRRFAGLARRGLAELDEFEAAALSPADRTSAAVIRSSLETFVRLGEFPDHHWVFEQITGYHLLLVRFLTTMHPMRNERDAENYLARLGEAGARLDEALADAEASARDGFLPPRFILDRVLAQLDGLTAPAPGEHVLVATFARRLAALGDAVPEERRAALVERAAAEVRDSVVPAFGRVRAGLAAQRERSGDDAGVWRLPRGAEFYAACLERYTNTTRTAEEIHALGLREVARIEGEMDGILRGLGFDEGPVKERYERLCASLARPDTDESRAAILAEVREVVRDAERRAESAFDLRPRAPVEVRRELPHAEGSAPAHYSVPARDGSQPGIYWIPLGDIGPTVPWIGPNLKTTAYHEAIPGHHFQVALAQELEGIPRYRSTGVIGWSDAYGEGWALYAERLADENGWYEGDAVGRLGYLQAQLFRARRLVVDTGLHVRRWTPRQVVEYGLPESEALRYVIWPGQACSYLVGQERILELREQARAALGAKFSIKEFHNVVLGAGAMPLDVLTREVEAWVASRRPAGGR